MLSKPISFLLYSVIFLLLGRIVDNARVQVIVKGVSVTSESMALLEEADSKQGKFMQLTGTIRYQDLEGGFYGFISNTGQRFTLNNLAKEYWLDGLVIQIEAKPVEGMATTTQFGPLLKVYSVKIVDDSGVRKSTNNNLM